MAIKLTNYNKGNLVKNLVKRHKLVPLLEQHIDQGEFEWDAYFTPKVGDHAFHPSSDCLPSAYDLWLKAKGETEQRAHPASLRKAFMVGHFWHAYIQWMVLQMGLADEKGIERQGKTGWGRKTLGHYKPYHYATGFGDIAPCRIPGHGDFLVDIKTMGAHDFRQNNIPAWRTQEWECQVNCYMDWFDLDRTIILAIMKDSPHDFKEFEFKRNQPLIDAIYDKWMLVSECLESEMVPREDTIGNPVVHLPLEGPVVT